MASGFDFNFDNQPTQPASQSDNSSGGFDFNFEQPSQTATAEQTAPVHQISPSLGGGAFYTNPAEPTVVHQPETQKSYGGESEVHGSERDHIMAWALGGASQPENIQLQSGKANPTTQPTGSPAGNKDAIENQAIDDYKAGKITLAEARGKVMTAQQRFKGLAPTQSETTTAGQLPGILLDTASDWSDKFLGGMGKALGYVATKAGEKVAQAIGTFPNLVASGGKLSLSQAYKTAPEFIHQMVTEPYNVAEEIHPDVTNSVSFQWGKEMVKSLTDLGLQFGGGLALEPLASRIATQKTNINVTPEQMGDIMTGRDPVGKTLSPEDQATVMKELSKPEVTKEVIKQAVKQGIQVEKIAPASPLRQIVANYLGGSAQETETKLSVGGEPIEPSSPFQALKIQNENEAKQIGEAPSEQSPFQSVHENLQEAPTTPETTPKTALGTALEPEKAISPTEASQSPFQALHELREDPNQVEPKPTPSETQTGSMQSMTEPMRESTTPSSQLSDQAKGTNLQDFIKSQNIEGLKAIDPALHDQAVQKLTEIHTEANKPVKQPVKPQIIKPIGEGELKTSKLSSGVEAGAIERKLAENFGDLPEYHQVNMKDQSEKAASLITSNKDQAVRIALGQEKAPKNILPESVFVAVENHATLSGNVELLRQLSNSKLTTQATAMGQRIRALGERDPNSPLAAIQEVQKAREEALKEKTKVEKTAEAEKIKTEIKKTRAPKEDWANFIKSLKC